MIEERTPYARRCRACDGLKEAEELLMSGNCPAHKESGLPVAVGAKKQAPVQKSNSCQSGFMSAGTNAAIPPRVAI